MLEKLVQVQATKPVYYASAGQRFLQLKDKKNFSTKPKNFLKPHLIIEPKLFYGDGFKGLPAYAPFDSILITCGAPEIPQELLKQLKLGGIMVCPTGKDVQIMTTVLKKGENDYEYIELDKFRFVPMLQNKV